MIFRLSLLVSSTELQICMYVCMYSGRSRGGATVATAPPFGHIFLYYSLKMVQVCLEARNYLATGN